MKTATHLLFTILFASSLSFLNAPLFNDKKHDIFARTTHKWVMVFRGIKSNGLQKFSILAHEIWALNIEKAISKFFSRANGSAFDVLKTENNYWIYIEITS